MPPIDVQVSLDKDVQPFIADKGQLDTVLVNLATNARYAMPEGGHLVFSAAPEIVSLEGAAHPAGLVRGRYVRIVVADTGTGMDATTLARASAPFFTNKQTGVGTGLGLPMAKGFADRSGGALVV